MLGLAMIRSQHVVSNGTHAGHRRGTVPTSRDLKNELVEFAHEVQMLQAARQRRVSRRDGQRAEAALASLGRLVEVTRDIASRAAQLRATRQIKLPDALILATAMQLAAEQILTLDRRWRGVDSRVLLLEP
jgi:predicted nucleic acid-binding protein